MKISWLNKNLDKKIKKVFELRYGQHLTDKEIGEIALNLVGFMENYLKFKWNSQYGNDAGK